MTGLRLEQVRSHGSYDDLWMIIYNKVYDITAFAQHHPGGIEVLLDCGGVDATEAFEDVGHSDDALAMLEPYFKGTVHASQQRRYQSARAKCKEVEQRAESMKHEKCRLHRQRRKKNHIKKTVEKLTMVVLLLVAVATVSFYVVLQHIKFSYYWCEP